MNPNYVATSDGDLLHKGEHLWTYPYINGDTAILRVFLQHGADPNAVCGGSTNRKDSTLLIAFESCLTFDVLNPDFDDEMSNDR